MQTQPAISPKRRVIDLGYRPREQFVPFHKRRARWSCLVAHRRAGKTVACVMDLIDWALRCDKPDGRFGYVAPHWNQAKDVAWLYVKRFTAPIPGVKLNESELYVEFAHNKARVRLAGADNYDRLRGAYLDGCILDEYGDMHPAAWPEVIRPMLADRKGWATFIGTPKGRNDFFHVWERAQQSPDWFALMLKGSDSGLLDDEELDALKAEMTPEQYSQEIECDFNAAVVGAYYGKEVVDAERAGRIRPIDIDPALPVYTAWDLGVDDSTSIWFFQVAHDGIRFVDYYENAGHGLEHYVGVLRARGYTYADDWVPHDAKVRELGTGRTRVETLISLSRKPRLIPAHTIMDGINAARIGFPRFWFDSIRCKHGLEALRQYHAEYDGKAKTFKTSPKHDWCFTSDTRVLTRYGIRQIKDLPYQGEVLTPCGWKQFLNPRVTRRAAQLVEVRFSDGLTVRCTPDHMFLTDSGWKSAEHLEKGSLIRSSLTLSRRISMAVSTVVGQATDIGHAVARSCIEMFGRLHLALFRPVVTSIIGTATPTTIDSQTWNACPGLFISQRRGIERSGTGPSISPTQLEPQRPSGIVQTKAASGTSATLSAIKAGRSGNVLSGHARAAAPLYLRWLGRVGTRRSSAARYAKPLRIESVKPLSDKQDVWCMTVPGEECFSLSNGAVVHNCSHAADAFRYAAMAWREMKPEKPKPAKKTELRLEADGTGKIHANMSVREIIEAKRKRRLADG